MFDVDQTHAFAFSAVRSLQTSLHAEERLFTGAHKVKQVLDVRDSAYGTGLSILLLPGPVALP